MSIICDRRSVEVNTSDFETHVFVWD